MLFTYPLMCVTQEISERIGRTTGKGLAGNIRDHYPENWFLQSMAGLLLIANTINIGADLGAMGEALKLLIGGPQLLFVAAFGIVCEAGLEIFVTYDQYVKVLRWLTLGAPPPISARLWGRWKSRGEGDEALRGFLIPSFSTGVHFSGPRWSPSSAPPVQPVFVLLAGLARGRGDAREEPSAQAPRGGSETGPGTRYCAYRLDTLIGMALSNLVALRDHSQHCSDAA